MGDYKDWINQNPLAIVESGSLRFCLEYREVEVTGQIVELTAKEYDILALLILNPRRVFTYEMIMDIIWKEDYTFYSQKAIHNHISNLKRKLRDLYSEHDFIVSIHGVGYKFDAVSTLIVKDLSRLGREYSYMGCLQDFLFPAYDVALSPSMMMWTALVERTTLLFSKMCSTTTMPRTPVERFELL